MQTGPIPHELQNSATWSNIQSIATTVILPAFLAWLAYKQAVMKKVVDATHTLSNSAMGTQLKARVDAGKALAVALHRTAEMTGAVGDKAAAAAADQNVVETQKVLDNHLTQQAVVDAKAAS
jgi:hypothetical protein